MRKIDNIVIHCAATPNGKKFDEFDIDQWHQANGWSRKYGFKAMQRGDLLAIGYHFVILLDGTVRLGRHVDEIGAHVKGYNSTSIGICMIGMDKFTEAQWVSLTKLKDQLLFTHKGAKILGHRDFPNVNKSCPGFDVAIWLQSGVEEKNKLQGV